MYEAEDSFSDAAAIDRSLSPDSVRSAIAPESGDHSMRWAINPAPRTPLYIRRARKRAQSVDGANPSNKAICKQNEARDQSPTRVTAPAHDEPNAPVRSSFMVDSGTGSGPSNNHQTSTPKSKPSKVCSLGHIEEVLARKTYRRPYETIPDELQISPTLQLRKQRTWSHDSNTPKAQDWHAECKKSITPPNLTEIEPVKIFEVPHEQRQLVKDLLRTSIASALPLPYFIILTDASYAEVDPQAQQPATETFEHHGCKLAFSGGLLTILSYNSHAQNGLLVYGGEAPEGSDHRFFELPDWSQPQMFHGVSFLVTSWERTGALLNNLAAREPLLTRLMRSPTKGERFVKMDFLFRSDLPGPLREEAVWVLQMEARRAAAIYAGEPLPFELAPKTDRVHVYNGWLILLENFLQSSYGFDEAPNSQIRNQHEVSSDDPDATDVLDREEARQIVQAVFEREIHKRMQ